MPASATSTLQALRLGAFARALLLLGAFFSIFVVADGNSTGIAIVSSSGKYQYLGCYNETSSLAGTNGARALDGGANEVGAGNMTVQICTSFCSSTATPYKYAGLEYARECWCAQTLNSNAAKLQDSACDLGCDGNNTEACGGSLKLSIYQLNTTSQATSLRAAWGATILSIAAVLAVNLL